MKRTVLPAAAVAVWMIAGPASSQTDYIADCRTAHADDPGRIACLEAAIRTLTGQGASVSGETAAVESAEETVVAASAGADAVAAVEADAQAPSAAPSGLGAEQVLARQDRESPRKKDKEEREEVTLAVTDYAVAANGNYILFLENGNVWRQEGKANARVRLYPNKKYTVTLKKGLLSGYRLTINEVKRTFVAERIK